MTLTKMKNMIIKRKVSILYPLIMVRKSIGLKIVLKQTMKMKNEKVEKAVGEDDLVLCSLTSHNKNERKKQSSVCEEC